MGLADAIGSNLSATISYSKHATRFCWRCDNYTLLLLCAGQVDAAHRTHPAEDYLAPHVYLMLLHSTWTELNWTATSRPSYTTRSLVTRVSVTTWLAAAKLGRLVLRQFVLCNRVVHGLGWPMGWVGLGLVGLGRDFSVFGGLGWVHYSKSTKNLNGLF